MLNFPGFGDGRHVTGRHHHATQHCKILPLENNTSSWKQHYLLKTTLPLGNNITSWKQHYLLETTLPLENITTSWKHHYLLETTLPLEKNTTSWKQHYLPLGNITSWKQQQIKIILKTDFVLNHGGVIVGGDSISAVLWSRKVYWNDCRQQAPSWRWEGTVRWEVALLYCRFHSRTCYLGLLNFIIAAKQPFSLQSASHFAALFHVTELSCNKACDASSYYYTSMKLTHLLLKLLFRTKFLSLKGIMDTHNLSFLGFASQIRLRLRAAGRCSFSWSTSPCPCSGSPSPPLSSPFCSLQKTKTEKKNNLALNWWVKIVWRNYSLINNCKHINSYCKHSLIKIIYFQFFCLNYCIISHSNSVPFF